MAALPADLRAVLKPITKYTSKGGLPPAASEILPTIDYLPLMAEFEVFGVQSKANQNEKTHQAQYDYYKSGSKIKHRQNDVASAAVWWLRSPARGNFCLVYTDGTITDAIPNGSHGVAPAFLV